MLLDCKSGTFWHLNDGLGHLPHGGQGGHSLFLSGHTCISGHLGQTGGTIADFKTYKSSLPLGTWVFGMPVSAAPVGPGNAPAGPSPPGIFGPVGSTPPQAPAPGGVLGV